MNKSKFLTFVSLVVLVGCGEDEPTDGSVSTGFDSSLTDGGVLPDGNVVDGNLADGNLPDTAVGEGGVLDTGLPDATGDSTVVDAGPQPQPLVCPIAVDDVDCPVCEADATCDAPTYTDLGDGTVSSSCCGLVWQQSNDAVQRNFADAYAYCADLTLAGGGWRLPTVTELLSLVEGTDAPTIDQTYFPGTPAYNFSSANASPSPRGHWLVTFYNGLPIDGYPDNEVWVRCVR